MKQCFMTGKGFDLLLKEKGGKKKLRNKKFHAQGYIIIFGKWKIKRRESFKKKPSTKFFVFKFLFFIHIFFRCTLGMSKNQF